MICPRCNSKIYKDCCLKCGYLVNGNQITTDEKNINKFEDQKLINSKFDDMYRNKKMYINFILGPLYFSFRGHLVLGILCCILHYINIMYIPVLFSNVFFIPSTLIIYLYIFLSRIMYCTFANTICISIDNLKINHYKRTYKNNYKNKLSKYKYRSLYLIINILLIILFVLFFVIYKGYKNGLL